MKEGQYAYANPALTGLSEAVKGEILKIRENPFIGQELAIRDASGRIYFGSSKYFTIAK